MEPARNQLRIFSALAKFFMQSITQNEIAVLVAEVSGIPLNVDPEADLYLDLGVASIHALQLLLELEERYAIRIPDEEFVESSSIAKITQHINRLLTPEGATSAG